MVLGDSRTRRPAPRDGRRTSVPAKLLARAGRMTLLFPKWVPGDLRLADPSKFAAGTMAHAPAARRQNNRSEPSRDDFR
jgi:hypothetical protein